MKRRREEMPPRLATAAFVAACLALGGAGAARAASPAGPDPEATAQAAQAVEADDARAAAAFSAGEQAFDAGDYRAAAVSFEAAYRAHPHHASLWNAARSWQRASDEVRAANLLEQYLREAPDDAPDRSLATSLLTELGARLARIQVQPVDGVSDVAVDHAPLVQSTRYVAPGEHVATGIADGRTVTRLFFVRAGELTSVILEAPAKPPPRPAPPPSETASRTTPRVLAACGAAATGIGVGLTAAFGIETIRKRDAFRDDPTQSRLDDAFASQTRTNVALGATIGAAIFTGIVAALFVDWKAP